MYIAKIYTRDKYIQYFVDFMAAPTNHKSYSVDDTWENAN